MSTAMGPERRAEIEKLVADATEGPWNTAAEAGELGFGYSPTFVANWEGEYLRGVGDVITGDGDDAEADLRLILVAPVVIPELLAENARLQVELTAATGARNAAWRGGGSRRHVLHLAVLSEGGEWTVGRVKRLYKEAAFGHVWRATLRADLKALALGGVLVQHDAPGRRFYTAALGGGE